MPKSKTSDVALNDINTIKKYSEYPQDLKDVKGLIRWYSLLGTLAIVRDGFKELLTENPHVQDDASKAMVELLEAVVTDAQNLQNDVISSGPCEKCGTHHRPHCG